MTAAAPSGRLIAFEGGDGTGKSTQLRRLSEHLRSRGTDPVVVREPGGTPLAERIRTLLLDPSGPAMAPETEALLYAAARAELYACVVHPALAAGRLVLSDRSLFSSLAYQAFAAGIAEEAVLGASLLATRGRLPDLVVVYEAPPRTALGRREGRDRLEARGEVFQERVARGYRALAARFPGRVVFVDAGPPPDTVFAATLAAVAPLLGGAGPGGPVPRPVTGTP